MRTEAVVIGAFFVLLGLLGAISSPLGEAVEDILEYTDRFDSPPSHIVIIMTEATRADHIGPCYEYNRTTAPNICDLAEDGVLFRNAFSQGTDTATSVPALLYSRPPHTVGIDEWTSNERLSPNAVSVAETLNETHTTAAIIDDNIRSIRAAGLLQGFEVRKNEDETIRRVLNRSNKTFIWHFIRKQAHAPYRPSSRFNKWGNISDENITDLTRQYYFLRRTNGSVQPGGQVVVQEGEQILSHHRDLYDGEIAEADSRIGTVVEELKKAGVYRESLIIFTSDHGELFGEHGRAWHSTRPWKEAVEIPLIVKFPENRWAGKIIERPVRHIDIVPTIYNYLREENSQSGISLVKVVKEEKEGTPYSAMGRNLWWMVQHEGYKYYLKRPKEVCLGEKTPENELLFNLETDPDEKANIVNEQREKAIQMRKKLCDIYSGGETGEYIIERETNLSTGVKERLRELGYLQ